jgi:putative addiction module antidote
MNKPLKLIPVGNSTGVVLPKEVLSRLHVGRGDQLYLTEAPDGGYRISAYDPEFARQMEAAERIMRKDREILRALAK